MKQFGKRIFHVLNQALVYLEIFGSIIDYLCFDSYKFESVIDNYASQKSLIKVILSLLMDYTKLKTLQNQLKEVLGGNKKQKSDSVVVINYSRVLFNLIISPNNAFKHQFVDE